MARPGHILERMPRAVYWTIGAAIAFAGAVAGRILAGHLPEYRVPIWLAGAIVIFFGLGILSLGTKGSLQSRDRDGEKDRRSRGWSG